MVVGSNPTLPAYLDSIKLNKEHRSGPIKSYLNLLTRKKKAHFKPFKNLPIGWAPSREVFPLLTTLKKLQRAEKGTIMSSLVEGNEQLNLPNGHKSKELCHACVA